MSQMGHWRRFRHVRDKIGAAAHVGADNGPMSDMAPCAKSANRIRRCQARSTGNYWLVSPCMVRGIMSPRTFLRLNNQCSIFFRRACWRTVEGCSPNTLRNSVAKCPRFRKPNRKATAVTVVPGAAACSAALAYRSLTILAKDLGE